MNNAMLLFGGLTVAAAAGYHRRPIAHQLYMCRSRRVVLSRFVPANGNRDLNIDQFADYELFHERVENAKVGLVSFIPQVNDICRQHELSVVDLQQVVLRQMQTFRGLTENIQVATVEFEPRSPLTGAQGWLCAALGVQAPPVREDLLLDLLPRSGHNVIFISDLGRNMSRQMKYELFLLCDEINWKGIPLTIVVFHGDVIQDVPDPDYYLKRNVIDGNVF